MKHEQIGEIIGWYGAFALIGAYAFSSFSLLSPTDMVYQFLNLSGALGILIVSVMHRNYQPALVNAFWALIALIALVRIFFS